MARPGRARSGSQRYYSMLIESVGIRRSGVGADQSGAVPGAMMQAVVGVRSAQCQWLIRFILF